VRVDANVTVTFNEAMDPASVNVSTIELRGPSNAPTPATVSYDAGSFTATLNPNTILLAGAIYTVRVKGGSADPRVKDVAGNALAVDLTSSFTTSNQLQVLSTTPTDGASDVLAGDAPRAMFSKPLRLSGLLGEPEAVLLQDAAGNLVPIRIGFHLSGPGPSIFNFAIVPQGLLQPLQTYTVTLKGGPNEPHITDTEGMSLESDFTCSFTTGVAPPPIPTFSTFAPNVAPANPIANDPMAVELGMKFRSDNDGFITGVRFYKGGAANGGIHVGHLWTSDGTLLGSRNFFSETENGWQQVLFQTPIPITANTTYVVSYFAPQGNYAADPGFFASTGVDSPPLHALQDGVDGGNGVFLYGPTGGFPINTFMSFNYYVDVVFSSTISPPQVLSTIPRAGGSLFTPIQQLATFSVTFTEPIDPASVNTSTVMLRDAANDPVPFTISFGAGNFTVTFTTQQELLLLGGYTVTLKGGVDGPHITNAMGTPLVADYALSFIAEEF